MFSLVYNQLKLWTLVFSLPNNEPLTSTEGAGSLPLSPLKFRCVSKSTERVQTRHCF